MRGYWPFGACLSDGPALRAPTGGRFAGTVVREGGRPSAPPPVGHEAGSEDLDPTGPRSSGRRGVTAARPVARSRTRRVAARTDRPYAAGRRAGAGREYGRAG
jgi:hypothetical protein